MKEQMIAILEVLGYPVYLQGSINSVEEYPDSFFTFWNFQTPENEFYSNDSGAAVWGLWVYFYSTDPRKVESVTDEAWAALKAAGWTMDGKPNDINTDAPTHTGRMFTIYGYDKYKEE